MDKFIKLNQVQANAVQFWNKDVPENEIKAIIDTIVGWEACIQWAFAFAFARDQASDAIKEAMEANPEAQEFFVKINASK